MASLYFFMVLTPVIVYVIGHRFFGLKKAIVGSLVTACAVVAMDSVMFGKIDDLLVTELSLFLLLGIVSIKLKNDRFFKFQPVVVNCIFVVWLSWLQWFDQPILIKYMPRLTAINPEFGALLSGEPGLSFLQDASLMIILNLLVHALIVAYTAIKSGDGVWLMARLSIYPLVVVSSIVLSVMRPLAF